VDSIKVIVTEYQERDFLPGGTRQGTKIRQVPPVGDKFILIHVVVEHVGGTSRWPVLGEDFVLIYKDGAVGPGSILNPKAAGYPTSLPGWERLSGADYEEWISFTVPKAADPREMVIMFVWPGVRYYWGLGGR